MWLSLILTAVAGSSVHVTLPAGITTNSVFASSNLGRVGTLVIQNRSYGLSCGMRNEARTCIILNDNTGEEVVVTGKNIVTNGAGFQVTIPANSAVSAEQIVIVAEELRVGARSGR